MLPLIKHAFNKYLLNRWIHLAPTALFYNWGSWSPDKGNGLPEFPQVVESHVGTFLEHLISSRLFFEVYYLPPPQLSLWTPVALDFNIHWVFMLCFFVLLFIFVLFVLFSQPSCEPPENTSLLTQKAVCRCSTKRLKLLYSVKWNSELLQLLSCPMIADTSWILGD